MSSKKQHVDQHSTTLALEIVKFVFRIVSSGLETNKSNTPCQTDNKNDSPNKLIVFIICIEVINWYKVLPNRQNINFLLLNNKDNFQNTEKYWSNECSQTFLYYFLEVRKLQEKLIYQKKKSVYFFLNEKTYLELYDGQIEII